MDRQITFISLFAGIGGMDLGLERAGMRCVAQVEIDDYASRVLAKHWPDVPRFRDVRDVGAHNLPHADLICGGFPCQDISNAGKRAGIDGERSGLWSEYARIVGELRPRYVLVENVAALLGRGIGRVLGDLAALGYDAEWHCIPAAAVGAPHIRDRVFIIAYRPPATDARTGDHRVLADATRNRQRADQNQSARSPQQNVGTDFKRSGADVADADSTRLEGQRSFRPAADRALAYADGEPLVGTAKPRAQRDPWHPEPAIRRVLDGVPGRLVRDPLRALGNAVVPQVAEYIGRLIVELEHLALAKGVTPQKKE